MVDLTRSKEGKAAWGGDARWTIFRAIAHAVPWRGSHTLEHHFGGAVNLRVPQEKICNVNAADPWRPAQNPE